MSSLKIKLLETEVASASIPIIWCVNKKWLNKNGTNWYILFATTPLKNGEKAEWRGKYKLTDLVGYVRFLRPGKNRIFAIIAYRKSKSFSENWEIKNNGRWDYNVIRESPEGPIVLDDWLEHVYLDVDLPEEVFANEPTKWEKKWVNFFFSTKAVDQCDFRKRRLLAYTIQPLLVMLMFVFRWIAFLGFLSVGARRLNARPLIRLNECTEDIWTESSKPWIIEKTKGSQYAPMGICIAFAPGVIILSVILCLLMGIPTITSVLVPLIGMLGFIIMMGIVGCACTKYNSKNYEPSTKDMDYLSCPQKINSIQNLPKEKQTIRLKFNGIKSRVCAPYRR